MTQTISAYFYAALACLPITMHLALIAGAPWGRFTMGGRFPERLPPLWRGLALVQAALLGLMAAVVLHAAQAPDPGWPLPAVLGVTALSLLANGISPSRPERRLWTPVLALMLLSGGAVAFL